MDKQNYKPSYLTRVTCKLLEKPEAFSREGDSDLNSIALRAENFAIIWQEIKDIRDKIHSGDYDRNTYAKELKSRKKALLALVQGANEDEVTKIVAGDYPIFFDGMKFKPIPNYYNN